MDYGKLYRLTARGILNGDIVGADDTIWPERNRMSGDRLDRFGWYVYDWANSPFSSSVVTVFLGPYVTSLAHGSADAHGFVSVLGIRIAAGSFFPYTISLSVL